MSGLGLLFWSKDHWHRIELCGRARGWGKDLERRRVERRIRAWDHRSHTEVGMKLYHKWELSQLGWTAVPLWRWKRPLELELLSHRHTEQLSPLPIPPLFLHDSVGGGWIRGKREDRKAPQSHLKGLSSPSLSFPLATTEAWKGSCVKSFLFFLGSGAHKRTEWLI